MQNIVHIGFNTDVPYRGTTFHVQTEVKLPDNPRVESRVYVGGAILKAKNTPLGPVLGVTKALQGLLRRIAAVQHQSIIHEVKVGRFDSAFADRFIEALLNSDAVDEVIEAFMPGDVAEGAEEDAAPGESAS